MNNQRKIANHSLSNQRKFVQDNNAPTPTGSHTITPDEVIGIDF